MGFTRKHIKGNGFDHVDVIATILAYELLRAPLIQTITDFNSLTIEEVGVKRELLEDKLRGFLLGTPPEILVHLDGVAFEIIAAYDIGLVDLPDSLRDRLRGGLGEISEGIYYLQPPSGKLAKPFNRPQEGLILQIAAYQTIRNTADLLRSVERGDVEELSPIDLRTLNSSCADALYILIPDAIRSCREPLHGLLDDLDYLVDHGLVCVERDLSKGIRARYVGVVKSSLEKPLEETREDYIKYLREAS